MIATMTHNLISTCSFSWLFRQATRPALACATRLVTAYPGEVEAIFFPAATNAVLSAETSDDQRRGLLAVRTGLRWLKGNV